MEISGFLDVCVVATVTRAHVYGLFCHVVHAFRLLARCWWVLAKNNIHPGNGSLGDVSRGRQGALMSLSALFLSLAFYELIGPVPLKKKKPPSAFHSVLLSNLSNNYY